MICHLITATYLASNLQLLIAAPTASQPAGSIVLTPEVVDLMRFLVAACVANLSTTCRNRLQPLNAGTIYGFMLFMKKCHHVVRDA